MSITLPDTNLASLAVGQSTSISLKNVAVPGNPALTQKPGTLRMHNESGNGLTVLMHTSGDAFKLPAGGWVDAPVRSNEDSVIITVIYIISTPPVNLLLCTYYAPGEPVPPMTNLGNSPIGGTASTTSIQTLSNENNATRVLVIDIGESANQLLVTIYNDGSFLWQVLQASVHQILKAQTSGNPLLIGQANDTSEVLGNLLVDGTAKNPAGLLGSFVPMTSPYKFIGNILQSTGTTYNYVLTGNGTPSIPTNVQWVLVSGFFAGGTSGTNGTYIAMGPKGFTFSDASLVSISSQCQVNNFTVTFQMWVQVDAATGSIDVKPQIANANGTNAAVIGFIA